MESESTPMMRQYRQIRNGLPADVLLFFRLGDFYEMFFDDAKRASEILDIALTKRNKVPMCGIPFHAADGYLAKLIRAGVKVAICDQVEDAALAKGIVKRDVTRVITPGTVLEETVLDSGRNNFLAGLHEYKGIFGLALLDISTGEFRIEESDNLETLLDPLRALAPSELLHAEELDSGHPLLSGLRDLRGVPRTPYEDWIFAPDAAQDLLIRHFQVQSLEGFGCRHHSAALGAAGAVLHYVHHRLRNQVDHIRRIQVRQPDAFLLMDQATIANLELVEARNPLLQGKAPTLLRVLDQTETAMGARLLREWVQRPLRDLHAIRARHEAVDDLFQHRAPFRSLRELLHEIKDLERLTGRLNTPRCNPRDLLALAQSLRALPAVKQALGELRAPRFLHLTQAIEPLPELAERIDLSIEDEPPLTLRDGGVIRSGFHPELDELRTAASAGRQWLAKFQADEQERTGIRSLKVRHNKVFGYYIEVSKANQDLVPEHYVRKQTLVNAERFITPELKDYENRILGAHERAVALEQELFDELRQDALRHTATIQNSAASIAEVDVLSTLAERAMTLHYVRPEMNQGDVIDIRDGRHPVIETLEDSERFVPNDTELNGSDSQLHILTGPNMAGKSTYIRQVALITLMAQMGSFVPASRATIGVVDRIFTRVGASDDLARGRSTFMVEMQETANILNNATANSLVVLDEIGRGTSTYDGISIAWAVAEHLHNTPACKAKTLFATHYHELTQLPETLNGVRNYSVAVRERGERIVFLRKIVEGASDRSYGIQVGRLAGLPDVVVSRAKEILFHLEAGSHTSGFPQIAQPKPRRPKEDKDQLSLFGAE